MKKLSFNLLTPWWWIPFRSVAATGGLAGFSVVGREMVSTSSMIHCVRVAGFGNRVEKAEKHNWLRQNAIGSLELPVLTARWPRSGLGRHYSARGPWVSPCPLTTYKGVVEAC